MLSALKQLIYPREFRIKPPVWPKKLLGVLEEITKLIQSSAIENRGNIEKSEKEMVRFLSDVGTGLWRMRRQIIPSEMKEPPDEYRRINRSLESTWDALTQGGFEIQDHTGDIIVGGEALHIISFQPMAGLTREQVIETLRPTIYYKGEMIQVGEVIVGKPERIEEE